MNLYAERSITCECDDFVSAAGEDGEVRRLDREWDRSYEVTIKQPDGDIYYVSLPTTSVVGNREKEGGGPPTINNMKMTEPIEQSPN